MLSTPGNMVVRFSGENPYLSRSPPSSIFWSRWRLRPTRSPSRFLRFYSTPSRYGLWKTMMSAEEQYTNLYGKPVVFPGLRKR